MRVEVRVPGPLRQAAAGNAKLEVELPEGATLGDLLDEVAATHPLLVRRVRDEQAEIRRYVNVYVNGEECRRLTGAATVLPAGAEVQILPSVAGG